MAQWDGSHCAIDSSEYSKFQQISCEKSQKGVYLHGQKSQKGVIYGKSEISKRCGWHRHEA